MGFVNPAKFGSLDPKDWRDIDDHYTQSLWPAKLPSKPSDYGDKDFHGRTHPEIAFVALERYTRPGDVAWDVFAGGCTIEDVCTEMAVKCVSTDLIPTRETVIAADARNTKYENFFDIVFCHPPYMNVVEYEEIGSLSRHVDPFEYVQDMELVIKNITRSLKIHRICVLIVGTVYINSTTIPLDCMLFPFFLTHYRLMGRVIRPFGETKGGKSSNKNENLWKTRRLRGGYWSLGYDTVMFFQKIKELE